MPAPVVRNGNLFPSLSFLRQAQFWKRALNAAIEFAPFCIFPAGLLTFASIVLLVCMSYVQGILSAPSVNPEDLTRAAGVGFVCVFAAMLIAFWATWIWMLRMSAFSRCVFLQDKADRKSFASAVAEIKSAQPYLGKVWFVASFYILLPAFVLSFCAAIQLLFDSPDFQKLTSITLPPGLSLASNLLAGLMTVICLAYTVVALVLSSTLKYGPGEAAHKSFRIFLRHPLGLLFLSLAVIVANLLVEAPQYLFPGHKPLSATTIGIEVFAQIWMGVTSIFLWSLSLYPFVQYIKPLSETESRVNGKTT